MTTTTTTNLTDSLGVAILIGDRVQITAYGGRVRMYDVRRIVTVRGATARGNLTHDYIAPGDLPTLDPAFVAVLRRDGAPGFEGNRPVCTCGARDLPSCLCDLTPREWVAAHPDRALR